MKAADYTIKLLPYESAFFVTVRVHRLYTNNIDVYIYMNMSFPAVNINVCRAKVVSAHLELFLFHTNIMYISFNRDSY